MVPTRVRWAIVALVALLPAWLAWSGMTSRATDATWSSLSLYVPDLDCTFWCSVKVEAAMETLDGASADRFDPSRRILST